MKEPIHKAVSPDGKLTFAVVFDEEYCVGFPDHAWHTHGDILVPEYGPDAKTATFSFFDSVIQDRQVICVSKRIGKEEEVWITDDAESAPRYMEDGEVLQLRFWSGKELSRYEKRG